VVIGPKGVVDAGVPAAVGTDDVVGGKEGRKGWSGEEEQEGKEEVGWAGHGWWLFFIDWDESESFLLPFDCVLDWVLTIYIERGPRKFEMAVHLQAVPHAYLSIKACCNFIIARFELKQTSEKKKKTKKK
jgi:hypothetical protein